MKLKTKEVLLIVFLILIVGGASYYFGYLNKINNKIEGNRVCFNDDCFSVEIVDTPETRASGLMNREFLAEDAGMLFIWEEEGIYSFWMKNTLIPLDMIWINSDKEIVFIHENAAPLNLTAINPGKNALYVLEINGGLAGELGIEVGEGVEIYLME